VRNVAVSNCAANVTVQLAAIQFVIAASLAVLRYLASPVNVTFSDFQIRSVISCGALCALHAIHLWTDSRTFYANCFSAAPWRLLSIYCSRIILHLGELTLRRLMSYIYIYMEHPFLMFLDHTQRRSTVGRTPLDE